MLLGTASGFPDCGSACRGNTKPVPAVSGQAGFTADGRTVSGGFLEQPDWQIEVEVIAMVHSN